MNRSSTTIYDRLTIADGTLDPRGHAAIPGSLQLGEVISASTAEKIAFELTLVDGRIVRGRIALRVMVEDSMVTIYPQVIIRGVSRETSTVPNGNNRPQE